MLEHKHCTLCVSQTGNWEMKGLVGYFFVPSTNAQCQAQTEYQENMAKLGAWFSPFSFTFFQKFRAQDSWGKVFHAK